MGPCWEGDGWVEDKGSKGSSCMFGERLGKVGVKRGQNGREAFPGTTNSSIDQQHRTTFCALKHASSSYKSAIFRTPCFWNISFEISDGGGLVAV